MAERNNDGLYWTKNAILFVVHVLMWTLWTLMIRGSKPVDAEQYEYDIVTVVFMTETTKFVLSIVFHFVTVPISDWISEVRNIVMMAPMGVYFAVPAFIYTLYNSLFFFNLIHFDPVSYRVLINMRILWSGILFQLFFSKRLGWQKWFALFLLMLGCAVNQLTPDFQLTTNLYYIGTIVFQSLTSSFGGVYSEVLLKRDIDISINVKNMYLYAFSMVFNFGFIASMRPNSLRLSVFFAGYTSLTWSIVFVGALCGFTTALFLRHLNILLKEYAHSGEMFLTAILSAIFFAQPIDLKLIASMMLVCISVLIYNRKQAVSDEEVKGQPASTDEEDIEVFVSLEEQTTKHVIIGESPEHSAVELEDVVEAASVKPRTAGGTSPGESGAV